MKRTILWALAVSLTMTACKHYVIDASEDAMPTEQGAKTKKFSFALKGDFGSEWSTTRGYLQADGKDLTDVWVLDYMDGALVQQVHQSDNTADDFGKPVMQLAYGSHHVYFIASRGMGATLDTDAKTLTFGKARDTFWKDYEVSVVSTSNGNRSVTLDRVVTKLRLVFNDVISDNAATFTVTPALWYYGLNYTTGEPVAAASYQAVVVDIPSTSIGVTGESVNIFGFSSETEWTTDVSVNCKDGNNAVIGSATIQDAPFVRNRITEFSGPLFSGSGSMNLSLNTSWADSYIGTW